MTTPPLLFGSKFKVLSLIGLSCSGIVGSFSAIHKSADRVNETVNPARDAIRQGLGHMFSGTFVLGSKADEWLSWLAGKRFMVLAFIRNNAAKIGSGQQSIVDQGQDWVKTAREELSRYFKGLLEMLPYMFYFWNRKRVALFEKGLGDLEVRDEIVSKILSGDVDAGEALNALLDDDELRDGVDKLANLFKEFSESFSGLTESNKEKIEKGRDAAFKTFAETISSAIEELSKQSESSESSKLSETLKKIAGAATTAGEKFNSESGLQDNEEAKKAQKATTDLMNWLISDLLLPMFTNLCDDGDDTCAAVTVEDDSDEETAKDSKK